jgi:hypothetical protein
MAAEAQDPGEVRFFRVIVWLLALGALHCGKLIDLKFKD